MIALKAYLDGLEARERKLLLAAAVAVVFAIFYWGMWAPLKGAVIEQQQMLAADEGRLADMKRAVIDVVSLQEQNAQGQVNSGGSLSSVVNRTAKAQKVVIARIQPQGEDLQVWIDQVPFNVFLQWLEVLKSQYGIQVSSLDLSTEAEAGVVRIRRLQLTRS
jgi:general secretion pathway protein M